MFVKDRCTVDTYVMKCVQKSTNAPSSVKSHAVKNAPILDVPNPVLPSAPHVKNRVHGKRVYFQGVSILLINVVIRNCSHHTCPVPCGSVCHSCYNIAQHLYFSLL